MAVVGLPRRFAFDDTASECVRWSARHSRISLVVFGFCGIEMSAFWKAPNSLERMVFFLVPFFFIIGAFYVVSEFFLSRERDTCFIPETRVIHGDSMYPFFSEGAEVDVLMGYYSCHSAYRGDVILVDYRGNPEAPIIKMIRAIPGDRFDIFQDGDLWGVTVNGEELRNSASVPYRFTRERVAHIENDANGYGNVIPPDLYLVFGENPSGSMDSTVSGLFYSGSFLGKVVR
jgi:signal peptidase I